MLSKRNFFDWQLLLTFMCSISTSLMALPLSLSNSLKKSQNLPSLALIIKHPICVIVWIVFLKSKCLFFNIFFFARNFAKDFWIWYYWLQLSFFRKSLFTKSFNIKGKETLFLVVIKNIFILYIKMVSWKELCDKDSKTDY